MPSRGERNNNPGNLEASPWTRSQPGYVGSDGRFAIFNTMDNGVAAQVKLLVNSYINKGHNTVSKIINRYGNDPGSQDDVSVSNYIKYVAGKLGVSSDKVISAADAGNLAKYMREFETGNTTPGSSTVADAVVQGAGEVAGAVLNPVGAAAGALGIGVGGWFDGGFVSRITYVVIGVLLIGLAIAALILLSDNGKKVVNAVVPG